MAARARVFTYDVSLDDAWTARSGKGGTGIPNEEEAWTPEHLLLAGLSRCVLTSFRYHARRAGLEPRSRAAAHGVVTRRESDGRFALVEATVEIAVELGTSPGDIREVIGKGERDCFVGASLTVKPAYRWTVNGEEIS
jgi:organic hydroperoxide reductase OsmC/OhrA